MCGIVAVLRGPGGRLPPPPELVLGLLEGAAGDLAPLGPTSGRRELTAGMIAAAIGLEDANRLLTGPPGVRALVGHRRLGPAAETWLDGLGSSVEAIERDLDIGAGDGATDDVEPTSAAVVRLKDAVWAVQRDRLPTALAVEELAGRDAPPSSLDAFTSVQQALAAIDRLEVRGRDSAGLHVLVIGHGLDLSSGPASALLAGRDRDPLFRSGSVRATANHLGFVYKAAAEIGELGDNTAAMRDTIAADELLHLALESEGAEAMVLGHTRWASVGIISQPNAHPLNSEELGGTAGPYVCAVVNGDVDNFADLKSAEDLRINREITSDAKVIPTLVSRRSAADAPIEEAFRRTVVDLEGSVAVAAIAADAPDRVFLAQRGSGQALYVGLAEDAFIVASEPYGLVAETPTYLRMDGETPGNPESPTASRGQVISLDASLAGTIDGIERFAYDGTRLPVSEDELHTAEITTRDIDRGDAPHYLLKEISEAPSSFRKTLRGKLVERDGLLSTELGPDVVPDDLRLRLRGGEISRIVVIGQGTAAVAGESLASVLYDALASSQVRVDALPGTELSGFGMRPDMSDTLVVAISQSGTTTDTNRTVDLVRARGAHVIAIVNRRNSDLTDKADGVLYTSDGRDVEMSVASTKAFYAQIAAGFLLADALADAAGATAEAWQRDRQAVLQSLRELPEAMERTLALRSSIAEPAHQLAPARRNWAVVGNGWNAIAAHEVRIKLSELCYKSIACDTTEDKKHIDLSAEPLVLVCATGLSGSNATDVAKEIAIYRAHKAAAVVIVTEGEGRFAAALHAITVPAVHPRLAFVLSAMAGHLFGYEAALAIDGQALVLREARGAIEAGIAATRSTADDGQTLLDTLAIDLADCGGRYFDGLRTGSYDGHLEASTAVRLAQLFRYVTGLVPLDTYQADYGRVGTPSVIVEDLAAVLTEAIGELTRPIDAIKHQAKTVTVGISRSDETLLRVPLVREVVAAGAPRDRLSYGSLRTLADLDPAVAETTGYTRYRIDSDADGGATAVVVDQGGIALEIPSRTQANPVLRGTKRRVATERELLVTRGRSDGRTIVIVPETKDAETTGLTLLHVRFHDHLPVGAIRGVLAGYRNRYSALTDAVTETEPTFREDLLADIPLVDLLVEPIYVLADQWRV